eukprot:m.38739 g.38739  ORF g.38739 m.38739 type:complete len:301 (-) comp6816_c0_seq3:1427-2329(-)
MHFLLFFMSTVAENLNDFIAGIGGGVSGLLVGQPFDVIKVRQQTSPIAKSLVRTASEIVKKEGYRSLFLGIGPPLLGVAGLNSVLFGSYGMAASLLTGESDGRSKLTPFQVFVAGTFAGINCCLVTTPTELVKCRTQAVLDVSSMERSAWYQFRDVVKTNGVRGLYKGWWITVARDAPSFGVYFLTYEMCKRPFMKPITTETISWYNFLVLNMAGGVAGVLAWAIVYPFDVIKTRLQSQCLKSPEYNGIVDCYRKMVAQHGYRSLFRGLAATLIRAFPLNAVTFSMYEVTLMLLNGRLGL